VKQRSDYKVTGAPKGTGSVVPTGWGGGEGGKGPAGKVGRKEKDTLKDAQRRRPVFEGFGSGFQKTHPKEDVGERRGVRERRILELRQPKKQKI